MKKLGKYLDNNEILTLAQFYERVYGYRGNYCDLFIFEKTVQDDKSIEITPYTDHSPMMVKKRKTFFEKTIDKLNLMCYNKCNKGKKEVDNNDRF